MTEDLDSDCAMTTGRSSSWSKEWQVHLEFWANPFTPLRVPLIFNVRRDPYEQATITSNTYYDWQLDHVFLLVPAQEIVGEFLMTFKEYPPRMKAASFSLDKVMEKLSTPGNN